MQPHSFAALVLGNFCFPPFLKRAHSDFQICESRFNHLTCGIATAFRRGRIHRQHCCRASVSEAEVLATDSLWFPCDHDHTLPDERHPTASDDKANDAKTAFVQQLKERSRLLMSNNPDRTRG